MGLKNAELQKFWGSLSLLVNGSLKMSYSARAQKIPSCRCEDTSQQTPDGRQLVCTLSAVGRNDFNVLGMQILPRPLSN